MADSSVKFDKNGDGIPRYTIYNYQKNALDDNTDYKVIGKWQEQLMMDAQDVIWSLPVELEAGDKETTTSKTATNPTDLPSYYETSPPLYYDTDRQPDYSEHAVDGIVSTVLPSEVGQTTLLTSRPELLEESNVINAIPQSVCSKPCNTGEIMIMNTVSFNLAFLETFWPFFIQ